MMQFKITFQVEQPGQLLPLSYQYELSAWLYRLMGSSQSGFSDFLHDKGYISGNKRFKLFTFSNLHVPKYEILDDRMKINCTEIHFIVSFLVEQAATELIIGLFTNQSLKLGDRISQVSLRVREAALLPPIQLTANTIKLRTISPLLVSAPSLKENGRLNHDYLHPTDEGYESFFFKNLLEKYHAAQQHNLVAPIDCKAPMKIKLLSDKPRKRGIKIKAFTPQETKIIGYDFDFEITAPTELIRLGLVAGFGGENALGFGASRLIK